jgi:tight adherence protein B
MYLIFIVGGALAIFLMVVGVVVSSSSEHSLVDERLGRYLKEEEAATQKGEKSTPVGDWLNTKLEKSNYGDGISRELARADIKLKASEYLALMAIAAIGVGAIAWYIGGRSILFAVLGAIFGMFLPRMYVGRQQSQRLTRFNNQLADMLNLMVNGLRAGYSTAQAMEAVSREMPSPISDEFLRVVQEMQLGLPQERTLENLLRRIPSEDLDLLVAAMNVQREVGGNLAEILDTISFTIRERVRIKGEVKVLTSQVMYSGRFLAMMPIIIALILWLVNKPYMMEFFNPETRIVGGIALVITFMMIVGGYMVMNKIATIDV